MDFEQWWSQQGIIESGLQPIMKTAFKELAKRAWDAALTNTTMVTGNAKIQMEN